MNDRELLLHWQQQQKVETQAIDQIGHYQALAVGLATFCQTFLQTILDPNQEQEQEQERVTRDEAMQLLIAAVQGR